MTDRPLLSICIPTYNRADYLLATLQTIVSQNVFNDTNDIEVVISDNHSTDNTRDIAQLLIEKYSSKIRYFKPENHIEADLNFEFVLKQAQGCYLKLNNDTLKHIDGSLDMMLHYIKKYKSNKAHLIFNFNGAKTPSVYENINADEVLMQMSTGITWIANFGIWRHDLSKIENFTRCSHLKLCQVDICFRLIELNQNPTVIVNHDLNKANDPYSKGGYNLYEVFLKNYLYILNEYCEKGLLSKKSIAIEKQKLLFNFFSYWKLQIAQNYQRYHFETNGGFVLLLQYYSPIDILKFYAQFWKSSILFQIKRFIKRMLGKFIDLYLKIKNKIHYLESIHIQSKFKRFGDNGLIHHEHHIANPHCISIGDNFYGGYNLRMEAILKYNHQQFDPKIEIGNNVKINNDVHIGCIDKIVIGNNVLMASRIYIADHSHGDTNERSMILPPSMRNITSKGPVIVKDNVWIGEGACILSGVTIGYNVIIGANAVVTKDIPDNSIAVGSPARIVKTVDIPVFNSKS